MALQTSGSVTLQLTTTNGETRKIVLDGQVGNQIQVGFRAKDGDAEVAIGTFTSIIASVANVLGAGEDFQKKFDDLLTDMAKIGPLAEVVNQLRTAQLFVTDLALQANYNETAGKYEFQSGAFGFRVEFNELELGPVRVVGFGVLFEYTKTATGEGVGTLKALPQ